MVRGHRGQLASGSNPTSSLPSPRIASVALRAAVPARHADIALTEGLQRSSVVPPLGSSRACLHTAFVAISVHCAFNVQITPAVFQWVCARTSLAGGKSTAGVSPGSGGTAGVTLLRGLGLGCSVHAVSHGGPCCA